ncbi:MAG: hypothetical protein U1F43_12640 [Myxococcota bacterium]
MTAPVSILGDDGWRYAAWVALDLRLLLFVLSIAGLAAAGVAALVVKNGRRRDFGAVFVLVLMLTLPLTIFLFNEVAQHPVFVVEAFFPFP